jgi:ribosomal protein S18 acetylase RimI-like enzyme
MSDRLVKLYALPDPRHSIENLRDKGIKIRRAMAYEKFQIVDWVRRTFGLPWAGECDVAFSNHPVSCYIATSRGSVTAFACYDSTYKNFFGPLGVSKDFQRLGIGTALLLRCLYAMAENGYAYAIIGDSDKVSEFYSSVIETIEIEGSSPGIYINRLKDSY